MTLSIAVHTVLFGIFFSFLGLFLLFCARMMRKIRNDNAPFLFRYSFIRAAGTYEFYLAILCIIAGILVFSTMKYLEANPMSEFPAR